MEDKPKILTQEEIEKLYEKIANGDNEARNKVIKHNMRLVCSIANKLRNTYSDVDELISVGAVGLIKAVDSFDIKRRTKLSTYVGRCVTNEILMFIRKESKHKRNVSLNELLLISKEPQKAMRLEDCVGVELSEMSDEFQMGIRQNVIREVISYLTPLEQQIVRMRYGFDDNAPKMQREIAKKVGISRSYVSRKEKKILKKLRNLPIHDILRDFNE